MFSKITILTKRLFIFFLFSGISIFFLKVLNKRTDFPCFYLSGERYLKAQNLYIISDPWPYKYLPSAALFFSPLSLFPQNIALVLFYIASFTSMFLSYLLLSKVLVSLKIKVGFWSIVIVFIVNIKAHVYDYANLQINHFLVLLLILSFYIQQRYPRSLLRWVGAFLFSLAGMFKIITIFISFYFLLKKEYRYFFKLLMMIFLILLLPLISYGYVGLKWQYLEYVLLMKNYHQLFSPDRLYQSIPSMLARLSPFLPFTNEGALKLILIVILLLLSIFIFKMIYDQQKKGSLDLRLPWLQFSGCLIFYPLVNPVGWKHGYVFLMPAIFFVTHYVLEMKLYAKWIYRLTIGAFLLLTVFSSEVFLGKALSDSKDNFSFNVFAAMILLFLVFLIHQLILNKTNET